MNECDLICVSSSDEDEPPAKKKRTSSLTHSESTVQPKENGSIICLDSEEETESEDVIIVSNANGSISASTFTDTNEPISVALDKPEMKIDKSLEPCLVNKQHTEDLQEDNKTCSTKVETNDAASHEKTTVSCISELPDILKNAKDLPSEALTYLTTCRDKLLDTPKAQLIFKKFPTLIRMFGHLKEEFAKSHYLKKFLIKQTKAANDSINGALISFVDVYEHLKSSLDSEGVELSKRYWKFLRKLEDTMTKLVEKLKEFDEAEVDFNADEEDSPFIKHERYSKRLSLVYKKYCKILKKNPYAGRITHERLDFVSSEYNEINIAISKKYKNNSTFPSYDELATYIERVVEVNHLPLNSSQLKNETEQCFRQLGNLLQLRRKKELYETHCSYIIDKEDPAEKDKELDSKLRISSKEGMVKIEQVCEEFCKKQELGINEEEEFDCSDTNDDNDEDQEEIEEVNETDTSD